MSRTYHETLPPKEGSPDVVSRFSKMLALPTEEEGFQGAVCSLSQREKEEEKQEDGRARFLSSPPPLLDKEKN